MVTNDDKGGKKKSNSKLHPSLKVKTALRLGMVGIQNK